MNCLSPTIVGLDPSGCRKRQARLISVLRDLRIDAAFIVEPYHINYFTSVVLPVCYRPILLLRSDGEARLIVPEDSQIESAAADTIDFYKAQRLGTLVEDQLGAALAAVDTASYRNFRLAIDQPSCTSIANIPVLDISRSILALRRAKDPDEITLIRHALRGCEAAYRRASQFLVPGVREIDIFAEMQSAAIKEVGEPIGEMGNDFQAGTPGGPPRQRSVEAGELMPLDVSVSVRGYRCDLCRTFVVDGEPTALQQQAADLVHGCVSYVEELATVGMSCPELYDKAAIQLKNRFGWSFPHHLGHGIGLSAHEAPRLNPHWDDELRIGDVFTVEPGLYHEELRSGVRIEENYWLTPTGLVRLSNVVEQGLVQACYQSATATEISC